MIEIRRAVLADIVAIQQIAKETWHTTYEGVIPMDVQEKFLAWAYSDLSLTNRIERSIFLIAVMNNEPVGFANFFQRETEASLAAIYLYPDVQGSQLGTKLLKEGVSLVHGTTLYVEVETNNDIGMAFYKAKGFVPVEQFTEELFGYTLQTTRMKLPLSS